jgi:hypothetical protein
MPIVSFCLYGTDRNYYTGLLENLQILQEWCPTFTAVVYKGVCDPSWTIPEWVRVIDTGKPGPINTLYRFLPLLTEPSGFVRDTDSRITERDRWCMHEFLKSSKLYHVIRDHVWHRSPVMGGMFGWKRAIPDLVLPLDLVGTGYGIDEAVLRSVLYPRILPDLLVHTNMYALHREQAERILVPQSDPTDFVGNVIWNGSPKFTYALDPIEEMKNAQANDQFALMKYFSEQVTPTEIPYPKRAAFFESAFIANYYLRDVDTAQHWLRQFEFAELPHSAYTNANYLFSLIGKRVVAVFDASLTPSDDEIFVYYGNYPDWHLALPCSSRVYRHVSRFWDIRHDEVRYNPAWEPIDTIYVLNLEERVDRWYDTLLALCAVHAPLHRVHHYKAKAGGLPPYVGATANHVDVITHFYTSDASKCLILEDDFVFIDDTQRVWSTLNEIWKVTTPYEILFLSLSKIGERQPVDALLTKTNQACTTSSGYILQRDTAGQVLSTTAEGLARMKETGDHCTFCIDRYWTKLPGLYCVRPKLGFQRPSYSNLLRTVSAHLD